MQTNQATSRMQKVADILLVTSQCSVSRLSSCVFSMHGDFPLLFMKVRTMHDKPGSVFTKTRGQSLPVSVWTLKPSNSSCLGKTNGSIVWYLSVHGKLFTVLMTISLKC